MVDSIRPGRLHELLRVEGQRRLGSSRAGARLERARLDRVARGPGKSWRWRRGWRWRRRWRHRRPAGRPLGRRCLPLNPLDQALRARASTGRAGVRGRDALVRDLHRRPGGHEGRRGCTQFDGVVEQADETSRPTRVCWLTVLDVHVLYSGVAVVCRASWRGRA